MSQFGLDLMCMLPELRGCQRLMQSCSSCWFIAPTLPMSTFECAPASSMMPIMNSHGFMPRSAGCLSGPTGCPPARLDREHDAARPARVGELFHVRDGVGAPLLRERALVLIEHQPLAPVLIGDVDPLLEAIDALAPARRVAGHAGRGADLHVDLRHRDLVLVELGLQLLDEARDRFPTCTTFPSWNSML